MGTPLWAAAIIFTWCWILVSAPIILRRPRQPGFSMQGWRVVNVALLTCLVLLAIAPTMGFLFVGERFQPFGVPVTASNVAIPIFGALTLAGLCIVGASIVLHTVQHPEIAAILHMPVRLYTWLYDDHSGTP